MTPPGKVEIRGLAIGMLDEVLRIHLAGMGYTLNARLGKDHLRHLYTVMAADPDCYVGVALIDGRPAGVVSGTLDAAQFAARLLRTMSATRLMRTGWNMLVHPGLIWLWAQANAIARPVRSDSLEVRAVLTAIVVDPQIHGRGIGRALVAAFEAFVRGAGVRMYRLDTQMANRSAAAFYGGLGFVEMARRADSIIFVRNVSA